MREQKQTICFSCPFITVARPLFRPSIAILECAWIHDLLLGCEGQSHVISSHDLLLPTLLVSHKTQVYVWKF